MMQPYLTELIARQRVADLHRSAASTASTAAWRPAAVRSGTALGGRW